MFRLETYLEMEVLSISRRKHLELRLFMGLLKYREQFTCLTWLSVVKLKVKTHGVGVPWKLATELITYAITIVS
jgi:hypothetical protein